MQNCIITNPRGPLGYKVRGEGGFDGILAKGENTFEVGVAKAILSAPINAANNVGSKTKPRKLTFGEAWKCYGVTVAWPEPVIEAEEAAPRRAR